MNKFIKVSAVVLVLGFISFGLSNIALADENAQDYLATPNPAHLNVINTVVGGTAVSSDFNVVVTGADANPGNFPGSEDGTDVSLTALTEYSVSVDPLPNYTTTYSENCSGTSINEFHPLTCTITNTFEEDVQPVVTAAIATPTSTIVATKIICDAETDLPNWGGGNGADITSTTATDYVATNSHCHLAPDWQFQVRYWGQPEFQTGQTPNATDPGKAFVGEAPSPWTTIPGTTDANGTISTTFNSNDVYHFFVREVLQDGYIPFGGDSTNLPGSAISAEMYCGSDVMNYDNLEQVNGPFHDGDTIYCVSFNVHKPVVHERSHQATINATKVVCDAESYLPNMSGGADITSTTATDFVAANSDHCHLAPDWQFQVRYWGASDQTGNLTPNAPYPGGSFVGETNSPWTTISGVTDNNGFISTTFDTDTVWHFWVREVLKDGYIPFSDDGNVSAEMYCGSDVQNYDNIEQADGPFIDGQVINCVAFNVPKTPTVIDVCPNIEGNQSEVPSGKRINSDGDCVNRSHGGGGGSTVGGSLPPVGEVLGEQTQVPVPGLPRTDGGNIPMFMIVLAFSGLISFAGLILLVKKPSFVKVF